MVKLEPARMVPVPKVTSVCREQLPTLCKHVALCSLRMSYVYRLQSSLAHVKLNASIGFQAMALLRVCMQTATLLNLTQYYSRDAHKQITTATTPKGLSLSTQPFPPL